MTIVRVGRKDGLCMEFEFDYDMDAFNFYVDAKEHYREDDLEIEMTNEEGEKR